MKLELKNLDMKEFKKYANTKEGKKYIIIFLVGFIMGILWKIFFVTAIVFGFGYGIYYIYKKRDKRNTFS